MTRLDFKALTATNRLVAQSDTTGDDPGSDQMRYDKAGNLIYDNFSPAVGQRGAMTYDAENRMVTAASGTQRYRYDANGRRVKRLVGQAGEVWQFYSPDGELLAEYPKQGAVSVPTKEYGYRGGQLLVVFDSTEAAADDKLKWLVQDHLGSTRMIVNKSGSLAGIKRRDYLPFGEELAATVGHRAASGSGYAVDDKPRQKFTGHERDTETGLDFMQARYCASVQGRFTSVDPLMASGRVGNPQSWNRYAYVLNRPLSLIDPSGMEDTDPQKKKEEEQGKQEQRKIGSVAIVFAGGSGVSGVVSGSHSQQFGVFTVNRQTEPNPENVVSQLKFQHQDNPSHEVLIAGPDANIGTIINWISNNNVQNIAIYGYSSGGEGALTLTNALTEQGRNVGALIMVDAVFRGGLLGMGNPGGADTLPPVPQSPELSNPEKVGIFLQYQAEKGFPGRALVANKSVSTVAGTDHFNVDEATARASIAAINSVLNKKP